MAVASGRSRAGDAEQRPPSHISGISCSRTCIMRGAPCTVCTCSRLRPQRLAHREGRQHEALAADREQQAVEDRQRQRQLDRERRALAAASVWISMRPRSASMLRRTTSMPTPRPEISVTLSAVEKPGWKIS